LEGYFLVSRSSDAYAFSVHRLVQEVTRHSRGGGKALAASGLLAALRWVDVTFVGDAQDVRDWPVLDPLLPHARAVAAHADASEIADPMVRLRSQAGGFFFAKGLHSEAEPLMRRALEILLGVGDEHPNVQAVRTSYVSLLQARGG
jgi:hypothetical protein